MSLWKVQWRGDNEASRSEPSIVRSIGSLIDSLAVRMESSYLMRGMTRTSAKNEWKSGGMTGK